MSLIKFVYQSIKNDLAMQLAVAVGVIVAAAVLTGALLVGDSMRGSLRDLTLDRLGPVDYIMTGDNFVREEIPQNITNDPENPFDAAGLILLAAGTKYEDRTSGVTLLGVSDEFWNLFSPTGKKPSIWSRDKIVVNQALADVLQIGEKTDAVISLWVCRPEVIPADSSLGRREETLFRKRLTVHDTLPNEGLGRFSLHADQKPQPLAIVPLHWLQDRAQLDTPGKINTIVLVEDRGQRIENREGSSILSPLSSFLSLADLGILVDKSDAGTISIKSAKMLFTKTQTAAITEKLPDARPVLIYFAESLKFQDHMTQYSLVAAMDEIDLDDTTVKIADDEIVLNDWTADDLGVHLGDSVEITYFEPESFYGQIRTTTATLTVSGIVPMQGTANDPKIVPEIHGVTDEKSLADWNPPFPFDAKRIRQKDEDYWDKHKTIPKAFVSLTTGRKLWESRFGNTTTFLLEDRGQRIEDSEDTSILSDLSSILYPLSSPFLPIKELGLKASAGTTPFNVLFLAFSFFIIASALMLLALLFRLSIERKAPQLGLLLSLGLSRRQMERICVIEGGIVAFAGAACGVPLGIAYTQLMIYGLHHWWIDAISVPFLSLHITASSLLIGFFSTFFMAMLVILGTLRSLKKFSLLQLLTGNIETENFIPATNHESPGGITSIEVEIFFLLIIFYFFPILLVILVMVIGILAILWRLVRLIILFMSQLLSGNTETKIFISPTQQDSTDIPMQKRKNFLTAPLAPPSIDMYVGILVVAAMIMVIVAFVVHEHQMVRAAAFFFFGSLLLIFGLICVNDYFKRNRRRKNILSSFHKLASSNIARHPLQSLLCIGLLASTSFLVLAVGAFHLDGNNWQGTGGFSLIAETRLPVYFDLNTEEGRDKLTVRPEDAKFLDKHEIKVIPLRVRSGDNAGCLNLYQPMTPRILGVGKSFTDLFPASKIPPILGKTFASTIWCSLDVEIEYDAAGIPTVPVILDANTAMYSLHLYKGVGEIYEMDDGHGSIIRCKVAALLANSILQGDIIMGERNLLELFPEVSGFRYFLIDTKYHTPPVELQQILQNILGDYGLTTELTVDRLNRLFAIQNTYLSTFRSLGGFGLILGTLGLGIVQLRNVLQRRKELALLRAIGFRKMRIVRLVVLESVILLSLGLGVGLLAAIFTGGPFLMLFKQTIPVCVGMFAVGFLSNIAAVWAVIHSPIAETLANE